MSSGNLELTDLGRLVANERTRRGMSLREAAHDTGIPFNTLARVERGHVPTFLNSRDSSNGVVPTSSNSLTSKRRRQLQRI